MRAQTCKKKADIPLRGRCDSFVVETNVHFPTDINLLYDAIRKVISLTSQVCTQLNIPGWRQSKHAIKKIKRAFRKLQKLKHSSSKFFSKKIKKEKEIIKACKKYVKTANAYIDQAKSVQEDIIQRSTTPAVWETIEHFIQHAKRQIDQITRRIVHKELIPHEEKVFSIFEPHTEWINKGKAGILVELGLRVAVVEDRFGFILNHSVMEKQTDDQVVQPLIKATKKLYLRLVSCSFDKGFHSPDNQIALNDMLDIAALPKKGKLSKKDAEHEKSEVFLSAKSKHSAVESAINALEVHGLDRCPDRGLDGFKRYVALAIMSRNIQIVGAVIVKREKKALLRQYKRAA